MDPGLGKITDGAIVAIIGGGPGGTATAIALKEGSRTAGIDIRIIIIEGKQFSGEQHHNQCMGVLSPPIQDLLEQDLKVPFPYHLSRQTIHAYSMHTARQNITLTGNDQQSYALRRVQFDEYMLETAREKGVEIHHARATGVEFHSDYAIVYTENKSFRANVIIGAFGLDENMSREFMRSVHYTPPPVLRSIVTKYHPGEPGMQTFGNHIRAFLPESPRIEFGAITPKGNHLTINIVGKTVDASLMDQFLRLPEVRPNLPDFENATKYDPNDLNYFRGVLPCGLARNSIGDRYVMVGDSAGLVRAFKGKGITSAIQSGIRAAQIILQQGISRQAFQEYLRQNQDIISDLPYGQLMRRFTILASRFNLIDPIIETAKHDPRLQLALFNAVSAHRPYKEVVKVMFSSSFFTVSASVLKHSLGFS